VVNEFRWPVRVYYEDTDHGGVVYYANYLKFMERARTEWLRSLGFEQDRLIDGGFIFAVRSARLEFIRPARFNDSLEVTASVAERSRVSLTFWQRILRGDELLCEGHIKVVCLDPEKFRPKALPADLFREIPDAQ
jgi:acyl-CoA thioester hydrolase